MQLETETGPPIEAVHSAVAFGLTVLVAGLGHLYLRRLRRGLAWLGLFAFTLVVLSSYTPVEHGLFVTSVLSADLSAMDVAFPGSILLLCLADLYLLERLGGGAET